MGCGSSKIRARKRKEKERQTTRGHNGEQLRPLSRTLEIAKCDPKKTFYIYEFEIRRCRSKKTAPELSSYNSEIKVAWRVKQLVLDKCLGRWVKRHKRSSKLYLVEMRASRLYTRFAIEKPKEEFDMKFGGQGCCYKNYVNVMVPRLIGSKYVDKSEKYQIAIKLLDEKTPNFNDVVIPRALNFLLLADVIANPSFAVRHDRRNIGRVFNVSDESHKRIDHKGACLRSCRGLATSIEPGGSPGFVLRLTEELSFFFTPINMIELLMKHFRFDVTSPLERDEIEALEWDLVELSVEMRAGNLGNGDESAAPEVHATSIGGVSKKPMCEELCDSYDESGDVVGKTTVEELFGREFPHVRLRYTHLPCLISSKGRCMPMEVCWITRGETIKNKYPTQEERCAPDQLHVRREVFEENCAEFTKQCTSTFRQFGFRLKQAQSADAGV